jgi:hypothetical protein
MKHAHTHTHTHTHKASGAGSMVQVVECLSSKCEALSTNPSTQKKKEREKTSAH